MNNFRERARQNRWAIFTYCFCTVSLASGIVYGWPSLRKELRDEDSEKWSSESALGAAFTAGAWSTQGLRFFTGLARDRYGTSFVAATCLVCVIIGSIGLAFCQSYAGLGLSLFAQGIGSGVQLCCQPVCANLFPEYAGATLASLSGAFQIAGLVYLAITSTAPNRKVGFLSYAGVLLILAFLAIYVLPRGIPQSKEAEEKINQLDTQAVVSDAEKSTDVIPVQSRNDSAHPTLLITESDVAIPPPMSETDSVEKAGPSSTDSKEDSTVDEESLWTTIISWKYFGLLQWFSIAITPLQYYVGSIGYQLEQKGDTGKFADLYSILYGCAAILSPAGGYIADRYTLGLAHAVPTALSALSFLFLTVDSIPLEWQSIGLACNGVGRMWVFGTFFAHVGRVFGYRYFGSLAGLGLLVSAVFSLLQYPLIAAAADGHATLVNLLCGTLLTTQLLYCGWLHFHGI